MRVTSSSKSCFKDDIDDFLGEGDSDDLADLRPSLILAIALKRAKGPSTDPAFDAAVQEAEGLVVKLASDDADERRSSPWHV